MRPSIKGWLLLSGLVLLAPLLSGCFLRTMAGYITGVEGQASGHISGSVEVGFCNFDTETPQFYGCTYTIWDDEGFLIEITSTFELISELGVAGLIIDPVILQVPEDLFDISGTFTNTSTATTNELQITEVTSFNVQPGVGVDAEPGQKFIILDFPSGTDLFGVKYDFDVTFSYPAVEPIDVKAMLAVRMDAADDIFYLPLLPCTSDFADVLEFTIPISNTVQDLTLDLVSAALQNPNLGCDGHVYDLRPVVETSALWGDNNCSQQVDPVDSLLVLRGDAGLPANTGDCPDMGASIEVLAASPHIWGDVDCTGSMTPVDSLKTLRYDAGLSVSVEDGCPEMGSTVTITELMRRFDLWCPVTNTGGGSVSDIRRDEQPITDPNTLGKLGERHCAWA